VAPSSASRKLKRVKHGGPLPAFFGRPLVASPLLVFALVPSLFFLGHWRISLAIPGTEYTIGQPGVTADGHDESDAGDHAAHCHESAATCSDSPVAGVSWMALASEAIALFGSCAFVQSLPQRTAGRLAGRAIQPELPPPNPLRFALPGLAACRSAGALRASWREWPCGPFRS
jgi:hypothetical protein